MNDLTCSFCDEDFVSRVSTLDQLMVGELDQLMVGELDQYMVGEIDYGIVGDAHHGLVIATIRSLLYVLCSIYPMIHKCSDRI